MKEHLPNLEEVDGSERGRGLGRMASLGRFRCDGSIPRLAPVVWGQILGIGSSIQNGTDGVKTVPPLQRPLTLRWRVDVMAAARRTVGLGDADDVERDCGVLTGEGDDRECVEELVVAEHVRQ